MRSGGLASLLVLLFALAACSRAPLHHQEAFVFGTRVEVWVAGLPEADARPAVASVLREFDRLHRSYHAWQPSELSALNAALAEGRRHQVSAELADLLSQAQRFTELGEQLFDPGIGRLIALWGFQSDEPLAAFPETRALAAWRAARPSLLDLRLDGQTASSSQRWLAVDFGGYLKGVALDRAASLLRARGVRDALVNIGGNVIVLGSKNGQPWRVGIQHPRRAGALATVDLGDGEAIGTSGDYQRYFEAGGRRYCHILDPRSAEPVGHTQSLTVLISPQPLAGTISDFASKPLFIAGDDWARLARKLSIDQVLRVDAEGRVEVSRTLHGRLSYTGGQPEGLEIVR